MRIAQVAPLWECVPPPAYGGIELIVSLLTDGLVRRGHDVTLFASGDSETLARLEPGCDRALRPLGILPAEYTVYEQMQLSKIFQRADDFDIIHTHTHYAALPYANFSKTPVVHTLHGFFMSVAKQIFAQHRHQNFVSISDAHRRPELGLNYVATVYNAIDVERFRFYAEPEEPPYLAFLGRLSPEKGPHLAIEIAKRTGLTLKIAGKVDFLNDEFFAREIEPQIDGKQIQFLGEADHDMKNELLGGAIATLFPITWREPFGLVMVESMVCGTPVIAMNLGSVPEVVADGETGFICNSVDECVEAIAKIPHIGRKACRDRVVSHFSIQRMVDGYEAVYRQQLDNVFSRNGRVKTPVLLNN